MDFLTTFLSPLGGTQTRAQVQRNLAVRVAPAAVRPPTNNVRASTTSSVAFAVGSLWALSTSGRLARGARQRLVRRRSSDGDSELPVPRYPGPDEPEKMREFALQLMDFYRAGGRLPMTDLLDLLKDAELLLSDFKALEYIEVPKGGHLNVVGDVHGQLFDFLYIFEEHGLPSEENPFLFNGDFVDRGSYSVEIMVLLLAWKLACPKHMHLNRGNHEDADMNFSYGFTGEVLAKYRAQLAVWSSFQRVFLRLPLSHVVNHDVFVTHGGLPRKADAGLADIEALDVMDLTQRLSQRQDATEDLKRDYFLMNDLMWADPRDGIQGIQSGERGGGTIVFGKDVTQQFLKRNKLSFMIRSHEVKEEGYEWQHDAQCLTVFSAPRYCDFGDNKGAVIRLTAEEDGDKLKPEVLPFTSAGKPDNYVRCMEFASPAFAQQMWNMALEQAGVK